MKIEDEIISEAVKDFYKKQKELTKEQFYDCLSEAILSGDFTIQCTPMRSKWEHDARDRLPKNSIFTINKTQSMTYMPFRRANELEKENENLKDKINKYKKFFDFIIYKKEKGWIFTHDDMVSLNHIIEEVDN